MNHRVGIISLGCPRNLVDSELILSRLKGKHITVTKLENSDVVIVNTCSFIKEAKEESINTILDLIELKQKGIIKKIIVYGCLVQRYKDELVKNLKQVDAFVGKINLNGKPLIEHSLTPKHFAYVKISEGCNNLCSYCVIPKIKGSLVSRPKKAIIEEMKALDKNNVKEINLVGQDITLYGQDCYHKPYLTELLKEILASVHNIRWIRLLYLHPAHISDDLINLIASDERICKYIDLPIQHINDRILKLMNRGITKAKIIDLIKKIRKQINNVYIRTSIITGFPSETEEEFKELLGFLQDIKFERLGAFIYSREEETRAYSFGGQINAKTKKKRFDAVMSLQQDIARNLNESLLGRESEVMIDEKDQDQKDIYLARLEQDAPEVDGTVYVRAKNKLLPGEFHKVKIVDTLEYDLVADNLTKQVIPKV